ncbi:hypothetical protein [Actinopolymorpha rutila]|uniref:Alpha-L-rhamnosidase six-hairpin glycosidase domain-containing protein n=1 Tax=Actinopolymorpha rutila TaxID=446787 RepID=A0A852ZFT2_9ACTN|nr:hypothetical protein [Actinopolymorpha rutila]NYH90748.1 hypothetical protein [Actinopolymorpha rutila]
MSGLRAFCLLAVTSVVSAVMVAGPAPVSHAEPSAPQAPRASDLADSGPSGPRWLSLPRSRIVVNPYDVLSDDPPAKQSDRPDLPLNAGYYANDQAPRLDDLLMTNQRPAGDAPGFVTARTGGGDDFNAVGDWTPSANTYLRISRGVLQLENTNTTGTSYGYASRAFTVDVDRFPTVRISVPDATQGWGLKVNDGTQPVDTVLQATTTASGVYFYDLKKATGWSGTKSVTVRIFTTGYQSSTQVDEVRFLSAATTQEAFSDDFETGLDVGWVPSGAVKPTVSDGRLNLTVPQSTGTWYGFVTRSVVADLDRYPILKVKVDRADKFWAIKVNDGQGADVIVQNNSTQLGTFSYDLRKITGWSGTKRINLRLFVNGFQTTASFDRVSLQAPVGPWLVGAQQRRTTWMPHLLTTTATFPDGSDAEVRDTFHGVDALTRSVKVTAGDTGATSQLSGQYFGTPTYEPDSRVITIAGDGFTYAVALPAGASAPVFYADRDAWSRGGPTLAEPGTTNGYWSASLSGTGNSSVNSTVGTGFAVGDGAAAQATARAVAAQHADPEATAAGNAAYFDGVLAKAPRPRDFGLHGVDARGVSAARVRKMYYRSWTFLVSDVLPPQPEVDNPFPQLATGKPALYLHGPAKAAVTASWDSSIGMQFLAYVDPDAAWGALEGLLRLVGDDGALPGEFLPAREAQTAWTLWTLTGDDARLRRVYPALRRLLVYKQDHPKYSGDTNANNKDLAFVSHALVDTDFARRIADRLNLPDDVAFWDQRFETLNANMYEWFWESPTAQPPQKYDPTTGVKLAGNVMSATPALNVRTMDRVHATGLLERFDSIYDPKLPLAGFGANTNDVRYGITSYTIYGLLANGDVDRADTLSNAMLRDIVATNMFAERYQWDESGPFAAGQRPSLFGVATVIDAVWMNNGYRMDRGTPTFVLLPGADGGVDGITVQGRDLDVEVSARSGRVKLDGNLVAPGRQCGLRQLTVGQSVTLEDRCATVGLR